MNEMPDENPIDEPRAADITVNPKEKNGKFTTIAQAFIKSFQKIASETIKDFCLNSSVHGMRYFTKPKSNWIQR